MTEMAAANTETRGELGPAMRELNEMQRNFVRALVTGKPGYGALTRAYRLSGYQCVKASTQSKEAHKLSRNPKIIEAIVEEGKKYIRGAGYAEAVAGLMHIIRNPKHREFGRAICRHGSHRPFGFKAANRRDASA